MEYFEGFTYLSLSGSPLLSLLAVRTNSAAITVFENKGIVTWKPMLTGFIMCWTYTDVLDMNLSQWTAYLTEKWNMLQWKPLHQAHKQTIHCNHIWNMWSIKAQISIIRFKQNTEMDRVYSCAFHLISMRWIGFVLICLEPNPCWFCFWWIWYHAEWMHSEVYFNYIV